MNKKYIRLIILFHLIIIYLSQGVAQIKQLTPAQKEKQTIVALEDSLFSASKEFASVGKFKIKTFGVNDKQKKINIVFNEEMSYLPLRKKSVKRFYEISEDLIQEFYPQYEVTLISDGLEISKLIPGYFREEKRDQYTPFRVETETHPLTKNLSSPFDIKSGLANRHIAVWQSHGRYYNQAQEKWMWQRPVLFQTVEDLYTQSYVLPYLVPMLENAGANVLLPRERDTQLNEVIVDNDRSSGMSVFSYEKPWTKGDGLGFADLFGEYTERQNPFTMGSYMQSVTTKDINEESLVKWIPDIPETGKYAVYVSYKTLANSSKDARYTVVHAGGSTEFSVNQTMGGGTWIYLGHFDFHKGRNPHMGVRLSNHSSDEWKIVTADAVKIGGGMGNISRKSSDKIVKTYVGSGKRRRAVSTVKKFTNYSTSNYPRFTEGARYWLQWAGAPDSIYSRTEYDNDYSDDFQSRGFWVNYMAGGSSVLPKEDGLNIPIDLAFAFHTDAGLKNDDQIIGTLAIHTVLNSDKKISYANNVSRRKGRELVDIVQTQIVDDIRELYKPDWNRRGLWNKNYSESRVPEVPTMLLELLSHQNFADMRFGLDPNFRFTVSRAIYKAMLKYIAHTNDFKYRVQPLPVENFSTRFVGKDEVELRWDAVIDPLEPTAKAKSYLICTRIDDGGFDNGVVVKGTNHRLKIERDKIYSFQIYAVNDGGKSFPSEILSVYKASKNSETVLIVNGFTRISAPQSFVEEGGVAGFNSQYDAGVPYINDILTTGFQYEFNRFNAYKNDNNPGFGASHTDLETMVIAGNTFDYPYIHGKAFREAGYSFVSTSKMSVLDGSTKLTDYKIVDLILGKERTIIHHWNEKDKKYQVFNRKMIEAINLFASKGGNLIVSGSNVVSDLVLDKNSTNFERDFVENNLKIKWKAIKNYDVSEVKFTNNWSNYFKQDELSFYNSPNPTCYHIEAPDVIEPIDKTAVSFCNYKLSQASAASIHKGKYGVAVLGFPIETITNEDEQIKLIKNILSVLMHE